MKEIQNLINIFENATPNEKATIRKSIYDLGKYMDKDIDDNLYRCSKCWNYFPLGTAEKRFETWTQDVCQNPYGGYFDRYEYKEETYSGFRYYCPICGERLLNHYQNQCYEKGKKY